MKFFYDYALLFFKICRCGPLPLHNLLFSACLLLSFCPSRFYSMTSNNTRNHYPWPIYSAKDEFYMPYKDSLQILVLYSFRQSWVFATFSARVLIIDRWVVLMKKRIHIYISRIMCENGMYILYWLTENKIANIQLKVWSIILALLNIINSSIWKIYSIKMQAINYYNWVSKIKKNY